MAREHAETTQARRAGSLYQMLADELGEAIRSGRLGAGTALASLRDCATRRGLSLNTVTAAYRLLEDQGLIAARPQSGFYVCDVLPEPRRPLRTAPIGISSNAPEDLIARVLDAQQEEGNLDLALACPRGARFYPVERLARTTAFVLRHRPETIGSYALPPGSLLLREQIARRGRRLGMALPPDDIVVTHGCMEALQLALRAVARAGDRIGIEAPSYFNVYPLLASLGLKAIEIPTHPRLGLDVDAVEKLLVEKRVSALLAMPTVHNPLGCTMPVEAKQRLAALLPRHGIPLIEDLVYAELQFGEPPQPAVKSFDREGWVIACSGFSKTLAPDYRVGWMEAGRFGRSVRHLKFTSTGAESDLLCETVGRFLENGSYEHHLRSVRRLYQTQLAAVRGLIARHFPAGTQATQPAGGFLLWVELPADIDSRALFDAALAERIVVIPGQIYSQGPRYKHCIRLSCAREVDEEFAAAIAALGRLAHALRGRPAAANASPAREETPA